ISNFADAWVGDYVARLRNFVTYYNVQYPSHQGSDSAILSLRYDLLPAVQQCSVASPNLLVSSGDMSQNSPSGWQVTPCDTSGTKCLAVAGGDVLGLPQDGPWGAQGGGGGINSGGLASPASGVTWLVDVPRVQIGGMGPGGNFGSGTMIPLDGGPPPD